MGATEMKVEQELDVRIKGRRKEEVVMHFFYSGITQNVCFFCFCEGQIK